jgi:hypothetical protein
VELNPFDPDALAQLGWRLAVRGNFEEGVPFLREAIARSVDPPDWYYHLLAIDALMQQGITLDRATLGNWVGRAGFHLRPIVEQMRSHLKAADRIFMDETRAPVLDPGRRTTKTGWFWAMVSDDRGHGGAGPPIVMFHYAPGRGGVHAVRLLDGYRGHRNVLPVPEIRRSRRL